MAQPVYLQFSNVLGKKVTEILNRSSFRGRHNGSKDFVGPRDRFHKQQNGVEEKRDTTSYILTQNVTGISLELSAAVNYVLSEQV